MVFISRNRLLFTILWFCSVVLAGCSPAIGPQDRVWVWPNPFSIIAAVGAGWAYFALPPGHPARGPALIIALVGIFSSIFTIVVNGLSLL